MAEGVCHNTDISVNLIFDRNAGFGEIPSLLTELPKNMFGKNGFNSIINLVIRVRAINKIIR